MRKPTSEDIGFPLCGSHTPELPTVHAVPVCTGD